MMKKRPVFFRKLCDNAIKVVSVLSAFIGIFFLGWILWVVIVRGFSSFNWAFFTELPTPPGVEGGGISNAILGTFLMTLIASVIGVPLGLLGGVYLSEFGRDSKIGDIIRFGANVMMGMPSIIIGLFIYTLLVYSTGNFSGLAGAVSLSIIMFPVVLRTTEDMLSMVPNALRESAMALGTPRWKVTLSIIFRAASTGLVTGCLLAVARVSGETAPLLFTALNSYYWPTDMFTGPTANLTVTITEYAMSPYKDWNSIAWGASLLITAAVLLLNITARVIFKEKKK
jgi:phosphate transport system permease protein